MTKPILNLNINAAALCDEISRIADDLQIAPSIAACGTTLFDFGIDVPGSIEAGLLLARVCLADLATVKLLDSDPKLGPWPLVEVTTDRPVAACMASQYAGWEVKGAKFFAMGSGPMRAAAGREPLFDEIGFREQTDLCVGVLESSKLPPDEVCVDLAEKCGIDPSQLTLLVAPTSSHAGTLQVVARSVETALHKLHELGFDLSRVVQGYGRAPLPSVAGDDLAAIGVTNDAILYGGRVMLDVTGDDASLETIGPRVPSSASNDYGKPFVEVMAQYNNDFYQIDPLLFSAAQITLVNVETGNRFEFGELNGDVLRQSFGGVVG
ncbi:MAG: methenyltetrahydromethanopterin cyclohydrolase [Planctomycetes bacterium]|nr:methenyltetrahydromethanopterin cyclohydrolase [Planctomycetota bacterium]